MVPFIVAIPIVLVPRLYFSQDYQTMSCVKWANDNHGDMKNCIHVSNIFEYAWLTLPTIDKKLSWLWYLPALFIDSCVNYPLLAWTQRRSTHVPIDWNIDW